jgi:hypothetical protein
MNTPVKFFMSRDLAEAMHLALVPVFAQRAGISSEAFGYVMVGDDYEIRCTRELAAGFIVGLEKMLDSPTHPPARKAECVVVTAKIRRALLNQRDAAGN